VELTGFWDLLQLGEFERLQLIMGLKKGLIIFGKEVNLLLLLDLIEYFPVVLVFHQGIQKPVLFLNKKHTP
jgi:hypothetical protein